MDYFRSMKHDSDTDTEHDTDRYTLKYDLGSIKCNVDASIFTEAWEFDMGACVRNSNGAFMK
ncbi:hypothetical protein JHK87_052729 [Glycine soja]|nr:hypothetical protein JHK87_052729 [Glycine soja]